MKTIYHWLRSCADGKRSDSETPGPDHKRLKDQVTATLRFGRSLWKPSNVARILIISFAEAATRGHPNVNLLVRKESPAALQDGSNNGPAPLPALFKQAISFEYLMVCPTLSDSVSPEKRREVHVRRTDTALEL